MTSLPEQHERIEAEIKKLEAMGGQFTRRVSGMRDSLARQYPMVFVSLSTFGVVATFYGTEKLIDQSAWLSERPHWILLSGVIALLVSGALMRKLR